MKNSFVPPFQQFNKYHVFLQSLFVACPKLVKGTLRQIKDLIEKIKSYLFADQNDILEEIEKLTNFKFCAALKGHYFIIQKEGIINLEEYEKYLKGLQLDMCAGIQNEIKIRENLKNLKNLSEEVKQNVDSLTTKRLRREQMKKLKGKRTLVVSNRIRNPH